MKARRFRRSVNITVRANPGTMPDAIAQTRQVLRRIRAKPGEDNFDFFNSESLITQFNKMSASGLAVSHGLIA